MKADRHIDFQREIIAAVDRNLSDQMQRLLVYIPTGAGKSEAIIQTAAHLCITKGYVCAILVRHQELKAQYTRMIGKLDIPEGYLNVGLEGDLLQRMPYDVILVDDCQDLPTGELIEQSKRTCIGFSAAQIRDPANPFFNAKVIYTVRRTLTFFHGEFIVEQFLVPLLEQLGFQDIKTDVILTRNHTVGRPDICATYNGEKYCLEVKAYRSPRNGSSVIKGAIQQVKCYRKIWGDTDGPAHFGCIFLCEIDEEIKENILASEDIFIWDIKNLLYMCQKSEQLTLMLRQITPYAVDSIPSVEPLKFNVQLQSPQTLPAQPLPEETLIHRLSSCKTGKKGQADKDYENVCADIVQHLFGSDFSRRTVQFTTRGKMFRIDMLCGIKETKALWTFLGHYYKTRFVIFEFKNYGKKIDQNLIYITEKYLYTPALRNVAFILSRKGFDKNALTASYGILKEHGKLIVDIQDCDLIEMLRMKEHGEEPSDYLLDLIETYLMAIDK